MIVQEGSLNTTALVVPDLIVQIVSPRVALLNGVPTNILGTVGTAVWGPVGAPVTVGSYSDYQRRFGPLQARKFDMGTAVAVAHQQGAMDFRCVRVTDGTDVAAQAVVQTSGITFTSRYTGTLGNQTTIKIGAGSAVGTTKVSVYLPASGILPEVFDNIGGAGNARWVNIAQAINQGVNGLRGRSEILVATAGASTSAPADATITLTGGTDGVSGVTASTLLGQDAQPRRGMYALRGTRASVGVLADCDDDATWATQLAYARSEGTYMILTGPPGDTVDDAIAGKAAAGIDDHNVKVMHGDWIYWNECIENGQPGRAVSPQFFVGGLLANMSPQHSTLNKAVFGVVGTQRGEVNSPYSTAELALLAGAGIDVITNPVPGGHYFGVRLGRNASSNPVVHGDNYTRMTNYIAATIDGGMGRYLGRLHSPETQRAARATLDAFFSGMRDQGMIGTSTGAQPWQVILGASNNPQPRVALGYMQADVKVIYLSIVEYFIVNVEGGQTVQIERSRTELVAA